MYRKGNRCLQYPGANANAVKELVVASLLLSVRPMVQGIEWVQTLEGANVDEQAEAQNRSLPEPN